MIIVTGITRSGLSLTMQMLNAGGYKCEGEYPAFEKYQLGEVPWLECKDSAVKLVDANLQLPPLGEYNVIRLRRNLEQQAKSLIKFSIALGILVTSPPISILIKSFKRDYKIIDEWGEKQNSFMYLDFEDLINNSHKASLSMQKFVGKKLDIEAMVSCVIERETNCYPTMLEFELIK